MTAPATIRFTEAHLEAFLAFSRDRSPLHDDGVYASRTPYGEVVVPGMCGVVSALAHAGAYRWSRIRGVFKAPMFLNRDYQVNVQGDRDLTLTISRGSTAIAEIVATAEPAVMADAATSDPPVYEVRATSYRPDLVALDALRRHAGMTADQVPLDRLSALGWASYFVGMVYPGRQAAFLSFDLSFKQTPSDAQLSFERLTAVLDDRFNRVTIRGRGDVLGAITLQAVVRPERITYPLVDVAAAATPDHTWWRGRSVVVSGGSRGLGAVLTRALLLAGSRVLFTYLRGEDDARAIAGDATQVGAMAIPCQVDLTSSAAASAIAAAAGPLGGIDAVISNATLPIRAEAFLDQTSAEYLDHVSRSLAMTDAVFRATLPLMRPAGWLVCVSSSYASHPRAGFSHYVTAKTAVEGLTRSLAAEHPALRFAITRPGRMRTDQTNAPIALEASTPATLVAARLLADLASPARVPGIVYELEVGGP